MKMPKHSIHIPENTLKGIKLMGDTWSLCILHVLRSEPLRFCGIQRALGDVNPTTLANRLKKLESAGLIKREEETVDKLSVAYSLSPKGKKAIPLLQSITNFAESNL